MILVILTNYKKKKRFLLLFASIRAIPNWGFCEFYAKVGTLGQVFVMLAVSPVRSGNKDEEQGEVESFSIGGDDFHGFDDDTNLLDSINFDDFFVGINDGDVLPDLEMDPEILAEFSVSGSEESEVNASVILEKFDDNSKVDNRGDEEKDLDSRSCAQGDQEIVSKRDESATPRNIIEVNDLVKHGDKIKNRKSSSQSKNSQGKRKVKVSNNILSYGIVFFVVFFNWVLMGFG